MRTGSRAYRFAPKHTKRFACYSETAGAPGDARGLFSAMRRFLEHRAVIGNTEAGLQQLERYLRDFIDWAQARGVSHPQQVSHQVLTRYQRHLHYYRKKDGQPLSLVSQNSKLSPLKGLFKWLTRQGEIAANPAGELELARRPHCIPRSVLSAEQAEQVLALPVLDTLAGLRDRAILELLYATGVRRMELIRLCCDDIDWERGLMLVRQGKGRKDRLVPVGERALHWVRRYLEDVRPRLLWDSSVRELFLGQEGNALSHWQMSGRVSGYVRKAGLGKHGSCHMFRHTMATLMLEGGAELRFIQAMLGHTDVSTTQIYTHVAIGQLQRVHASSHPGVALRQRAQGTQSVQNTQPPSTPEPASENATQALLDALAQEAMQEQEDETP